MSDSQKSYIKAIYIEQKSEQQAIRKVLGFDPGYAKGAFKIGLLKNPAVKEFLDVIKLFYIQIAPVAQLKEVDLMLTARDPEVQLRAAKDIQDRAHLGPESDKAALPVTVVLNLPQQTNVTTVVEKPA